VPPPSMEEFVYRSNVKNYTRQLASSKTELERKSLVALLQEEHVKAKIEGWMPLLD
jgi:hypothetical protein